MSLVGWSGGGIRTGTFATRYPEKVDRYVIWASSNYSRKNPDAAPALPKAGAPMLFQTRAVGVDKRWLGTVKCEGMVEPGMPEMIWSLNKLADPVGATWGPGGLRAPTRTYWGWNANGAKKITFPTLIMAGEQDDLTQSNLELLDDLGSQQKVFLGDRVRDPLHQLGEAAPRAARGIARLAEERLARRRDVGHVPRRREREDRQSAVARWAAVATPSPTHPGLARMRSLMRKSGRPDLRRERAAPKSSTCSVG